MANRSDPAAKSIRGTNPQNLVEKILQLQAQRGKGKGEKNPEQLPLFVKKGGEISEADKKKTDFLLCVPVFLSEIQESIYTKCQLIYFAYEIFT